MTFLNALNIRRLVEDHNGVIRSSGWSDNTTLKLKIPPYCIEVAKNQDLSDIRDYNLIPKESIRQYFIDNPKIRKLVYFNGTFEEYNSVLEHSFRATNQRINRWFNYLFVFKGITVAAAFARTNSAIFNAIVNYEPRMYLYSEECNQLRVDSALFNDQGYLIPGAYGAEFSRILSSLDISGVSDAQINLSLFDFKEF